MILSSLSKTWLVDVDGTIVKHNGFKIDGFDTLLDGVREFFSSIPSDDKIILLTARSSCEVNDLKRFLSENGIRIDYVISDLPVGERILINDKKISGLEMAHVFNKERDSELRLDIEIDEEL